MVCLHIGHRSMLYPIVAMIIDRGPMFYQLVGLIIGQWPMINLSSVLGNSTKKWLVSVASLGNGGLSLPLCCRFSSARSHTAQVATLDPCWRLATTVAALACRVECRLIESGRQGATRLPRTPPTPNASRHRPKCRATDCRQTIARSRSPASAPTVRRDYRSPPQRSRDSRTSAA